jgi:hypothetical protein
MRYFIDTEFWERPGRIDLISIGIVAEDGREFYAENWSFDWPLLERLAADGGTAAETPAWLIENVKPHLRGPGARQQMVVSQMREEIRRFVSVTDGQETFNDPDAEFWGWYSSYDWVVFCWIFGRMIDLPKGFPMYCRDLKQLVNETGTARDELPKQDGTEHDALADARWNKQVFEHMWARQYPIIYRQ